MFANFETLLLIQIIIFQNFCCSKFLSIKTSFVNLTTLSVEVTYRFQFFRLSPMASHASSEMMECLKVDLKNHRLNYTKCPIPKLMKEDEEAVVIKVALVGVCGTDLHIIEVHFSLHFLYFTVSVPRCIVQGKFPAVDGTVLGHELVGTIVEVGKNEDKFKVGDRVAVNPSAYMFLTAFSRLSKAVEHVTKIFQYFRHCGMCEECRRDRQNFCVKGGLNTTLGIMENGGYAQYCKVATKQVYKLGDSLQFGQGTKYRAP